MGRPFTALTVGRPKNKHSITLYAISSKPQSPQPRTAYLSFLAARVATLPGMAGAYDPFGFPLDDPSHPPSQPAPLGEHQQKWSKFWLGSTRSKQGALARTPQLHRLVWGGVPSGFRGGVWPVLLGVSERRAGFQPDYYSQLLTSNEQNADDPVALEVRKDGPRTWPRHAWLDVPKLERVLLAFARHNPTVGYCQGLNAVCATLLLFISDEEEAFYSLMQLIEARFPAGFWSRTLENSTAEQCVLKGLVRNREPGLSRTLARHQLVLELFSTQWFITLFVGTLPLETSLRIWDVVMLGPLQTGAGRYAVCNERAGDDGAGVLHAAALALLRTVRPSLRGVNGPAEIMNAVHAAIGQVQPGSQAGAHFAVALRRSFRWLQRYVPLGELRSVAISEVLARLALLDEVRQGSASPSALAEFDATTGIMKNGVSVRRVVWWRKAMRPRRVVRRGIRTMADKIRRSSDMISGPIRGFSPRKRRESRPKGEPQNKGELELASPRGLFIAKSSLKVEEVKVEEVKVEVKVEEVKVEEIKVEAGEVMQWRREASIATRNSRQARAPAQAHPRVEEVKVEEVKVSSASAAFLSSAFSSSAHSSSKFSESSSLSSSCSRAASASLPACGSAAAGLSAAGLSAAEFKMKEDDGYGLLSEDDPSRAHAYL